MRALVTGAAGFIGSHLAERLVAEGWHVRGLDGFTGYYDAGAKRANVASLRAARRFQLVEADLTGGELAPLVDGVDAVFHLAAQPGVRASWAQFPAYVAHNIDATERLLEAMVAVSSPARLVFASSSSVYGQALQCPTPELAALRPSNPYGVTKVAGELLVAAYVENFGLDAVGLRFFSVYGPRQRPDMALHRMVEAGLAGRPFPLYGEGDSIRDLTYVSDAVEACVRVASADTTSGTMFNVAGGSECSVLGLLAAVGEELGSPIEVERRPGAPGDVRRTSGSIELIGACAGWKPDVSLACGIASQVSWHRRRRAALTRR